MNHPYISMLRDVSFSTWFAVGETNPITTKPVPRWPDRRSYRAHQRDASKRRAREGGAK